MDNIKTIKLSNLQTSFASHQELARLFHEIHNFKGDTLLLNFEDVTFISANQFSVLGCIISTFHTQHPEVTILAGNVAPKLSNIMQRNGFGNHLSYKSLPDINNTVIPYKIFDVTEIDNFEKYITISIFSRNDLPQMSSGVRNQIIDNILEIFNNVHEHTCSQKLFTCGQFFPRKHLLYFTITDSGETIPYNVRKHCQKYNIELEDANCCLSWALQPGHSTKIFDEPRGLGLYLLSHFINLNKGELYIVSGEEAFEQNTLGKRYKQLSNPFPGTIVTMAFNLTDQSSYCLESEINSNSIF